MNYFMILLTSCIFVSCTTLQKDKNNFTGEPDIKEIPLSSDHKGSDSGIIDGLNTVYFDYDSSSLSKEHQDILIQNINWIKSHLEVVSIELEGHCDEMGSESYNIGLGHRRAEFIRNFLIEKGIASNKLSIVSYGEERPFSEIDRSKNRRVNFVPIY